MKQKGYSNGKKLRSFKLSQQAVFLNNKNQVLLLKSTDNDWLLPGGRVDQDEYDLTVALKREVKEELGFDDFEIFQPIGIDQNNGKSTLAIAFFCKAKNLENIKLSHEHTEYLWADKSELEAKMYYKNLAKNIKEFLK